MRLFVVSNEQKIRETAVDEILWDGERSAQERTVECQEGRRRRGQLLPSWLIWQNLGLEFCRAQTDRSAPCWSAGPGAGRLAGLPRLVDGKAHPNARDLEGHVASPESRWKA